MQSLFAAFNSLGSIYAGLIQALGAADKVTPVSPQNLQRREPRETLFISLTLNARISTLESRRSNLDARKSTLEP
eukprot:1062241-Amorphochlora_amoeboformis.AAC.1